MIRPLRRLFTFAALLLLLFPPAARVPLGFLPGGVSPVVSVTVELKGSFAETVETTITLPLEEELHELPGLKKMSSVSESEESRVILFFDEGTPPEAAYLAVREAVDRASIRFPENAQRPRIDQSDPSARPVFVVAMPPAEEEELRRRFEHIEGVGTVAVGGGARRELLIRPDGGRLAAAGSSIPELAGRLQAVGVVGSFHPRNDPPLMVDTRARRVQEFRGILLAPGLPLSGVARVTVSSAEGKSLSRINGRSTSVVTVTPAGGANEVALCRRLRRLTASIAEAEVLYDYGSRVEEALSEAATALVIGAAAVAVATLLFLRKPGSAAAVAGTIPFCALVSLSLLSLLGMELDVMSLAGIAVGVGLVVDAGIVYVEFSDRTAGDYLRAAREARSPILLGGLTTVVVFLPLVFAPPGVTSQFSGLAVAIVASVGASLLYVFGLLPALLTQDHRGAGNPGQEIPGAGGESSAEQSPIPGWFIRAFRRMVNARRWTRIPISLAALVAPFLLLSLPRDAGTALDDGLLRVTLEYPAATTSRAVEADAGRLEQALLTHSAVRRVTATFEDERARFEIACGECRRVRNYLDGEAEKGHLSGFLFFPDDTPGEVRIPVIITAESQTDARDAAGDVAQGADALVTARGVVFHFKESPDAAVVRVDLASARLSGVGPRLPA
ncbi:MAG: efflux RND transporter permease subunit, partial [Spirochaetaceae bacterium]